MYMRLMAVNWSETVKASVVLSNTFLIIDHGGKFCYGKVPVLFGQSNRQPLQLSRTESVIDDREPVQIRLGTLIFFWPLKPGGGLYF